MVRSAVLIVVLLLVLAVASSLEAHHSIAAVYDSSRPATIDGTLVRLRFVNPHPFLEFDARGANDMVERWHLELDNLGELRAIGMTLETLKPGDRLIVTGSPSRTEPHALYVRKMVRPADGFEYEQVGPSPRIRHAP